MKRPSWNTNNSSTSQIPSILWDPNLHHRVHNSPSLLPILSQMNPTHNLPPTRNSQLHNSCPSANINWVAELRQIWWARNVTRMLQTSLREFLTSSHTNSNATPWLCMCTDNSKIHIYFSNNIQCLRLSPDGFIRCVHLPSLSPQRHSCVL
jgi:hypothetical protein